MIRRFAVGDDSSRNASQPDKSAFNMPFESEQLYTTLRVRVEIAVGLTPCLHSSEPRREREYWMHMLINDTASARYYHPFE